MDWIPGIGLSTEQQVSVELIGIAATVLAAFAAVGAIVQAGRQSRKALDTVARERRLDFELEMLKELAEFVLLTHKVGHAPEQAQLR
ncbi:MAG: hypothetical protein H0U16_12200 [Actinobacteria bacterium]|nr:hypothetical protein [Actinomycetota bacterium]